MTNSVSISETVNDGNEEVDDRFEVETVGLTPRLEDLNKETEPSVTSQLLQKLGFYCCIGFLFFVLLGILEAIRRISKIYLGNSTLLWCAIDLLIIIGTFYIGKYFIRKKKTFKFKEHVEAVTFTLVVVGIIAIGIAGRIYINNKIKSPQIEKVIDYEAEKLRKDNEKLKIAIQKANLSLPIVVDEFTNWTNIRLDEDVVVCTYMVDDASFDLYEYDIVSYKEEIADNMAALPDKQFINLCVQTKKTVNFHIVSQWEKSKHIDLTFGDLELEEIANRNKNN